MPDISMCANHKCPMAHDCYRHEAIPSPGRQVYGEFKPDDNGHCDSFLEIYLKRDDQ